jgi:hypothetical protein
MELSLFEEKQMRMEAGELGASIALKKLGLIKDEISEREAFRIYGPAKVRSWNNEKLIRAIKIGSGNSKKTYSKIELDTVKRLEEERKLK